MHSQVPTCTSWTSWRRTHRLDVRCSGCVSFNPNVPCSIRPASRVDSEFSQSRLSDHAQAFAAGTLVNPVHMDSARRPVKRVPRYSALPRICQSGPVPRQAIQEYLGSAAIFPQNNSAFPPSVATSAKLAPGGLASFSAHSHRPGAELPSRSGRPLAIDQPSGSPHEAETRGADKGLASRL